MKKTLLSVLVLFSAIFAANYAFSENVPFSTGPVPTQTYHTVSDNSAPAQSQTFSQSAAAAEGQEQVAAPAAQAPTDNENSSDLNLAGVDTSTHGELTRMTQDTIAFEQQANAHIQNLTLSNQAIAVAIQNINQQIAQLQQQLKMVQTEQMAQPNAAVQGHANGWQQLMRSLNRDDVLVYVNMIIAAIFLMGFGLMMGRRFQGRNAAFAGNVPTRKINVNDPSIDDTKTEYDFMGTREAIPAQLDLARSYIVMGDHVLAKNILKMVVDKGDKEQSFEAKLLLERMKITNPTEPRT